jgi:pimeloyl-ACP methyl ester carboxylesterase
MKYKEFVSAPNCPGRPRRGNTALFILPDVSHFGMLQNPGEFGEAVVSFVR